MASRCKSEKEFDYDTNIAKLEALRSDIRYPKAFTMHTDIPFVRDLQNSAITTTNQANDRRMKINNLKEMADTIIYMEEHGIESRTSLEKANIHMITDYIRHLRPDLTLGSLRTISKGSC